MEFTLTHPDSGLKSIVVLFDGVPYEANSDHPWWDEIVDLVLEDDPRVLDLFPIRPVQQPSTLIEGEPAEDIDPVAQALFAYLIPRGLNPALADPEEYSPEELAQVRSIFDRAGFGTCEDSDCLFCYGPRS
jgi:hypothetical protein